MVTLFFVRWFCDRLLFFHNNQAKFEGSIKLCQEDYNYLHSLRVPSKFRRVDE